MEIFIIILGLICIIAILKIKTNIFQSNNILMENMTCDRKEEGNCIYDDMIIAGNKCIYGKKNNNSIDLNENINYNINEVANLNDNEFKRYLVNNAIDNSKGYFQLNSINHINKCIKEIDIKPLDLNIKGLKAQFIRIIALNTNSSDWINDATIQIFSKGIDISPLQLNKKTVSNITSVDIGSEFDINSVKISSNKSGNSKWVCALVNKNGEIVFSELFTSIPSTPSNINTQTKKIVNITLPLGCYNTKSDINTYHGKNYNERSCQIKAKANNHKYFRLENNNQCYSGNSYNVNENNVCISENSKVYQIGTNPIDNNAGATDYFVKRGTYRPTKNMLLGYITLSKNYAISFNIKLESIKPYETQIFVITSLTDTKPTSPGVNEPTPRRDTEEFSRIPGMWVCPNSASINYVYSTQGKYDNQISNCIRSLPLNQEVNVMIIKNETNFKLYINTELVENIDKPEINNKTKNEGQGAIYSSYNYEAASSEISNFMYISSDKPITIDNLNVIKNNENIKIDTKRNINYHRNLFNKVNNPTIFSIKNTNLPNLDLSNPFPKLGIMDDWEMVIEFVVQGGQNTWRAIIGDMYNYSNWRGWGVWVSNNNSIHWSWKNTTWEPNFNVILGNKYSLHIECKPDELILHLYNHSNNTKQTATKNTSNKNTYEMSSNGPVTIGGWISYSAERFQGTISSIEVKGIPKVDNDTSKNYRDASKCIFKGYTKQGDACVSSNGNPSYSTSGLAGYSPESLNNWLKALWYRNGGNDKSKSERVVVNDFISRTSSNWNCNLNGMPAPIRSGPGGEIECMSRNGRDCLWDQQNCQSNIARFGQNPVVNTPLICGEMHNRVWGGTGYDNPNHWCKKARNQIGNNIK
jgi:hypothetical protein